MEKMTKPANMLVQELMQHTMMESLRRKMDIWGGGVKANTRMLTRWRPVPTCTHRCGRCCSFPVRWASLTRVRRKRRFVLLHPATPVRWQTPHMWPHSHLHACKHVIRCAQTAYLGPDQLVEVWSNVEANPVDGSRQSDPTEEQDKQHEVGISGGEIHHLGQRDERQQHPFRAEINGDLCSVKSKKSNLSSTKLRSGKKAA